MKGGKRPGAGRPKGATTKRTAAVALQAAALGVTPIEVMLASMRAHYAQAIGEDGGIKDLAAAKVAADLAKDAAPYVHPRLQSVDATLRHRFEDLSDEELDDRIARLLAEGGVAGAAGGEGEAP